MIVYIPQLIKTAEQAEALPVGTVATFSAPGLMTAAVKNDGPLPGWWCGDARVPVGKQVGWTALVPVEAEEEEDSSHGGPDHRCVRAVTPWQIIARPSQDRRGDCA